VTDPTIAARRPSGPVVGAIAVGVLLLLVTASTGVVRAAHLEAVRPSLVNGQVCGDAQEWQKGRLIVSENGCRLGASFVWLNATLAFGFGFDVGGMAEINPSGEIVRYTDLAQDAVATTSLESSSGGVTLSTNETQHVANGSGRWNPTAFSPNGSAAGPEQNISGTWQTGPTVGTVGVQLVFHVGNSSGIVSPSGGSAPSGFKFDLNVNGWPWASSNDSLGLWMSSEAPDGAHFVWHAADQNLTQTWNGASWSNLSQGSPWSYTGPPIASLVLGPVASASGLVASQLNVSGAADIFYQDESRDRGSVLLVNFSGPGGYNSLHYDPWVVLDGLGQGLPTGTSFWTSLSLGGIPGGVVVVGSAVALVLGVVAIRLRAGKPGIELAPSSS
jgi:hypothetical protein